MKKFKEETTMNLDRIIAVRNNKTVYRDGDKTYKVFDSDYKKSEILNEALNQSLVEETGLNIPKLLGVTAIEDKWVIVSEYIPGKTLDRLMQENPEKKNTIYGPFSPLTPSHLTAVYAAPAPIPPPMMGRAISSRAFTAPKPVMAPRPTHRAKDRTRPPKMAGK